MPDDLGWLMRPVARDKLRYETLFIEDGVMDLYDIALLNHMLDVYDENDARMRKAQAAEAKRQRGR